MPIVDPSDFGLSTVYMARNQYLRCSTSRLRQFGTLLQPAATASVNQGKNAHTGTRGLRKKFQTLSDCESVCMRFNQMYDTTQKYLERQAQSVSALFLYAFPGKLLAQI